MPASVSAVNHENSPGPMTCLPLTRLSVCRRHECHQPTKERRYTGKEPDLSRPASNRTFSTRLLLLLAIPRQRPCQPFFKGDGRFVSQLGLRPGDVGAGMADVAGPGVGVSGRNLGAEELV